jgi:hypothetical protein
MPHVVVEVRHIGIDHDAAREELRRWLEQQGIRPMLFEHSTGGPGITFRVHFTMEDEAAAFAEMFHGWLNDGREPEAGILWDLETFPRHTRNHRPCSRPIAKPSTRVVRITR